MKLIQHYKNMRYKNMRIILLVFTFICVMIPAKSQELDNENTSMKAKNSTYASFGGPSIFFAAIYERHILINNRYSIGVKGGIGTSFSSVLFPHEFNFPVGVFFLYGKSKHHLDVSLNVTTYILDQYNYIDDKTNKSLKLLYVPSVCYRYQKKEGGFVGRVGISPIINFNSVTNSFSPWIDISLGWAF